MTLSGKLLHMLIATAQHGDVHLKLEQDTAGQYTAAFVSPGFGGEMYPLFDPLEGESCLAATGDTQEAALLALQAKIEPYLEDQL